MNTSNTSQILQEIATGSKISGEPIFKEHPDIGSPLAFLVNETLSFHNKSQNLSCVWYFGN